jgi:enoyl-CoA hydratase/carnithine racemase
MMIELDYANQGAIALLTLKRPPANAFTPDGLLQLQHTVERLNADERVRAIVITGDGPKFFSAGADLNTFADGDREVARTAAARFGAAFETLQNDGRRTRMRAGLRYSYRRAACAARVAGNGSRPAAVRLRHADAAVAGR